MLPTLDDNFETAAKTVLRFLHERLGFDLWMVTRTEGKDWIVLQAEDHGYGVEASAVFRWTDSFCSRMVAGRGPRIAPQSDSVPAYAEAPIGRQVKIGAYVGVPLTFSDGSLFGTLCAIHPSPQPESITTDLPLVELLAAMLSRLLQTELRASEATRRAERSQNEAETDAMTGLYNRRGWNRLLDAEDARCRRYGHPASILAIDLNGLKAVNDSQGHPAGDELILRAGRAIKEALQDSEVAARVGGDEYAVLGPEYSLAESGLLLKRIRGALDCAKVSASLGLAIRVPPQGLEDTWQSADQAMYSEKAELRPESGLQNASG